MKLKRLSETIYFPYDKTKRFQSAFYKIIRVIYLSFRSFFQNELSLKASLLTFYSLVSIVPIFAVVFAIAKGFGFETFLENQILTTFKNQENVISIAIRFAHAFIENMKGQVVIGVGAIFLFFSVFGLFQNIEKSLNSIWNVQKHRGFIKRWFNYLMALIFFPIIFVTSLSITVFIHAELIKIQNYALLKYFSPYFFILLRCVPYILIAVLFCYLYLFTPNTKVHFRPRFFAGIVAGILFQLWQIIYVDLQIAISTYDVVYGSFAALPLFLIWMQVNFFIFLFGATLAAQIEGDHFFRKTSPEDHFKMINRKQLHLLMVEEIASHFLRGEGPLSIEHLSEHLGVSVLDVREVINILETAGLVAEISPRGKSLEQYQLVVNPELFTVQEVCDLTERNLSKEVRAKATDTLYAICNCISNFDQAVGHSPANINLKDFSK